MPQTEFGYRRRNSLRHASYDYTAPGAYFVTICEHDGRCVFGQVIDQAMILNPLGQLTDQCLQKFVDRHPEIRLDVAVIMPNHAHLLLWLITELEQPPSPLADKQRRFGNRVAGSLSVLIGGYKSSVTQTAQNRGLLPGPPLWQDNFYDHIVRGEQDIERIRSYIQANPARWIEDQLHPDAPPNAFNWNWRRPR